MRVEGELRLLATSIAVRVMSLPPVTPVPGSPKDLLGIALYDGIAVPVIAIGSRRDAMVICQHAGELVALVGAEVVQWQSRAAELDATRSEECGPPFLDLSAICLSVQRR